MKEFFELYENMHMILRGNRHRALRPCWILSGLTGEMVITIAGWTTQTMDTARHCRVGGRGSMLNSSGSLRSLSR